MSLAGFSQDFCSGWSDLVALLINLPIRVKNVTLGGNIELFKLFEPHHLKKLSEVVQSKQVVKWTKIIFFKLRCTSNKVNFC